MEVISDEEIKQAIVLKKYEGKKYPNRYITLEYSELKLIAQAQLEADKEKVREIFEELEAGLNMQSRHGMNRWISTSRFNKIKQKYLGGN